MTRAAQRAAGIRAVLVAFVLVLTPGAAWPAARTAGPHASDRLDNVRQEIERLRGELAALEQREAGVLGELERAGTELRLRRAELQEVELRLDEVVEGIRERRTRLDRLEDVQDERRRYLGFRLRELYKAGPEDTLRRWLGADSAESTWAGVRYASYLNERDGRVLAAYRSDRRKVAKEAEALEARQRELEPVQRDLAAATARLERTRERRTVLLQRIREDQSTRRAALEELEGAASELERVVGTLERGPAPAIDVRRFRGLLDWPADGPVGAGFGSVVHPRFGTRVPHPGLDIETGFGAPIRTVFDGTVVFAEWMRGYGLTAIVDHGGGVLSIYAHASVLLVEPGESLLRGQRIGLTGETGSLQGALLYFELRVDGKAVDPTGWLRPRNG